MKNKLIKYLGLSYIVFSCAFVLSNENENEMIFFDGISKVVAVPGNKVRLSWKRPTNFYYFYEIRIVGYNTFVSIFASLDKSSLELNPEMFEKGLAYNFHVRLCRSDNNLSDELIGKVWRGQEDILRQKNRYQIGCDPNDSEMTLVPNQ